GGRTRALPRSVLRRRGTVGWPFRSPLELNPRLGLQILRSGFDQDAEPVHGLRPAFLQPGEHARRVRAARAGGAVDEQLRPAAATFEVHVDDLVQAGGALLVFQGAGDDHAHRRHHLAVLAADAERAAPRRAPAHPEDAAWPRVRGAVGDREALRRVPPAEMFGAGPGLEHPAARRVDDARHHDGRWVFHSALPQVACELVQGPAPALIHAFAALVEDLALGFGRLVRQPGDANPGLRRAV